MNLSALLYITCIRLIILCQSLISINNNFYILFINVFIILSYFQKFLLTVITLRLMNKFVTIILETRDYFDATASNWNTSAHSRPLPISFV